MKKTLLVLATMALMSVTANAQSVKFGVRGGVNLTSLSLSGSFSDNFGSSNRTGFYIGPTLKVSIPVAGLGVDVSALYDQREAKVSSAVTDDNVVTRSLAIPVNVCYGWGLGSIADVFLFAGPQVAFNFANGPENWSMNKSAMSINAGVGFTFLSALEVKGNYNFALGKTGEYTAADASTAKLKASAWQIGLAYWF